MTTRLDTLIHAVLHGEYDRTDVYELAELAEKALGKQARARLKLKKDALKQARERLDIRRLREARLSHQCSKCGSDSALNDPAVIIL